MSLNVVVKGIFKLIDSKSRKEEETTTTTTKPFSCQQQNTYIIAKKKATKKTSLSLVYTRLQDDNEWKKGNVNKIDEEPSIYNRLHIMCKLGASSSQEASSYLKRTSFPLYFLSKRRKNPIFVRRVVLIITL